ncbi:unnamed protein product [Oppiella nova]|uniref:Uncharacterized protein n=1 Tax=Oppiella nova TaxID=334625 RepID=A0A7R9QPJ1_9ACAR|nr:unnamed protein product [Oppiella nova]CAG2169630.1 unnamed protein product [Oppiella nova]
MCDKFCDIVYREKYYEIERQSDTNSVPFVDILTKIQQIIPIVDMMSSTSLIPVFNKEVNFNTHVFEIIVGNGRPIRINHINERITRNVTIKVTENPIARPIQTPTHPLPVIPVPMPVNPYSHQNTYNQLISDHNRRFNDNLSTNERPFSDQTTPVYYTRVANDNRPLSDNRPVDSGRPADPQLDYRSGGYNRPVGDNRPIGDKRPIDDNRPVSDNRSVDNYRPDGSYRPEGGYRSANNDDRHYSDRRPVRGHGRGGYHNSFRDNMSGNRYDNRSSTYNRSYSSDMSRKSTFNETTNTSNDKQLICEMTNEIIQKYCIFLDLIKEYSRNNCDLITDFEWNHVIHKQMTSKGFKNYDPSALNRYDSILEAKSNFVYFEEFNTLNDAYLELMNARTKFLTSHDRRWRKDITNNSLPVIEDIFGLYRTFTNQQKLQQFRKDSTIQKRLENSIKEIKGFNLIVQSIGALKGHLTEPGLYLKISKILSETGLEWTPEECERILKEWIVFYEKNTVEYKDAMKRGNRIVEYIYEFLHIITTVSLETVFYSNQKITESLESIAKNIYNKSSLRLQKRLKINDRNIDKIVEKVQNELQMNSFKNSDDIQIVAVITKKPTNQQNTGNKSIDSQSSEKSRQSSPKRRSRERSPQKSTKSSSKNVERDRNRSKGPKNVERDRKRPKSPKGVERDRKRSKSPKNIPKTKNSSSMTTKDIIKYTTLLTEIRNYSHNNSDLITDYEWIHIIHSRMGYEFRYTAPERWRTDYKHFVDIYLRSLRRYRNITNARMEFPLFVEMNNNYFNSNNDRYYEVMNAREDFAKLFTKFKSQEEEALVRTIRSQKYNSELSDAKIQHFQKELESKVDEIKAANLMVQITELIQTHNNDADSSDIYQKVAEVMSETGFRVSPQWNDRWRPYQCEEVLRYWTIFYSQNCDLYEVALRLDYKIIKYLFEYLNIIPVFLTNAMNIHNSYLFSPDSPDEDKLKSALITIRTNLNKHNIIPKIKNEIQLRCDDSYQLDIDYRSVNNSSADYVNHNKRPNSGFTDQYSNPKRFDSNERLSWY